MTTLPYNFTYQPAPDMATCRAAAFRLLEREDDPAFGLDPSDAGDTAITPDCTVRILDSPADCPLYVEVAAVLCNGLLRVRDITVPAVTWKVSVDEVALGMCKEAWEVESEGS